MRSRALTGVVSLVVVVAAAIFIVTAARAVFYAPESEIAPPADLPISAQTASKPERLLIPALRIDASVQRAGVNAQGAMTVPTNFRDVAWYKYGTVPGQIGSAVIDGHVDNGLGLPGVFKHLGDLQIGDDVYVLAEDGTKLHFVVEDIQEYPYNASPVERIFAATDAARLNLITCTGTWLRGRQTYSDRLVVYTKLAAVDMPGDK
jgi:hypothetical protein